MRTFQKMTIVQCDQASTGKAVAGDDGTKDFRIRRLLHSTVEQAEYVRVRELINRIDNHPHRDELQADLMQDNVHNPFSENSTKMIRDLDHFELCVSLLLGKRHCTLYMWNLLVRHGVLWVG